jgi:hypothetical protein
MRGSIIANRMAHHAEQMADRAERVFTGLHAIECKLRRREPCANCAEHRSQHHCGGLCRKTGCKKFTSFSNMPKGQIAKSFAVPMRLLP